MDILNEDVRFEIIKRLDYKSINSLCIVNRVFREFCGNLEPLIFKYLLRRDYNVNTANLQDDQAKNLYLEYYTVLDRTLTLLRNNGASKFADFIQLDTLLKPDGINRLFRSHNNFVIFVPLNDAIDDFANILEVTEKTLFDEVGNSMIANDIGFYNNGLFNTIGYDTYNVVPGISVNEQPTMHLGIVNNFVNVNLINEPFVNIEYKWEWADHFVV